LDSIEFKLSKEHPLHRKSRKSKWLQPFDAAPYGSATGSIAQLVKTNFLRKQLFSRFATAASTASATSTTTTEHSVISRNLAKKIKNENFSSEKH
jgi:hypothetical protein